MGTNYYARIIPKEEDKQKLKEAIDNNDYNTIESMVKQMYSSLDEYTHKGGEIHLGKASCGWKFLWNPNVHEYCNGFFDKNNHFVPVYKSWKLYELTKQSIIDFIMRDDQLDQAMFVPENIYKKHLLELENTEFDYGHNVNHKIEE